MIGNADWLSTYLGNPPLLQLKTSSPFFWTSLFIIVYFSIRSLMHKQTREILEDRKDLHLHMLFLLNLAI